MMSFRKIHYMQIISNTRPIKSFIIISKNIQKLPPPNCNLSQKWH